MQSFEVKIRYLSNKYPCLYVLVMRKRGKDYELEAYMSDCKSYENDWTKFSMYIHGYWIPFLQKEKEEGRLKEGTVTFRIFQHDVIYEGLLDEDGKAYGWGTCTSLNYPSQSWTGFFV